MPTAVAAEHGDARSDCDGPAASCGRMNRNAEMDLRLIICGLHLRARTAEHVLHPERSVAALIADVGDVLAVR